MRGTETKVHKVTRRTVANFEKIENNNKNRIGSQARWCFLDVTQCYCEERVLRQVRERERGFFSFRLSSWIVLTAASLQSHIIGMKLANLKRRSLFSPVTRGNTLQSSKTSPSLSESKQLSNPLSLSSSLAPLQLSAGTCGLPNQG